MTSLLAPSAPAPVGPEARRWSSGAVASAIMLGVLAGGCQAPRVSTPTDSTRPSGPSGRGGAPAIEPPPIDAGAGIALGDTGAPAGDAAPAAAEGGLVVYAHSGSDLFRIDPANLHVTRVGNFVTRTMPRKFFGDVTDIAIDKAGKMTGITFNQLLRIDTATAECEVVAPLQGGSQMNGLSWIRGDDGTEILAATGNDGSMLEVNPVTGESQRIGSLSGGQRSSGDLVSVQSYGTLITLRGDGMGDGSDLLARLDHKTGQATVIGPTGFRKVWGIGFWGNRVFGFSQTGEFILIDPRTGKSELVMRDGAYPFWGAGVSTSVTVID